MRYIFVPYSPMSQQLWWCVNFSWWNEIWEQIHYSSPFVPPENDRENTSNIHFNQQYSWPRNLLWAAYRSFRDSCRASEILVELVDLHKRWFYDLWNAISFMCTTHMSQICYLLLLPIGVFMWRHIKLILQVIALVTAMLVSTPRSLVLETQQNVPVTRI